MCHKYKDYAKAIQLNGGNVSSSTYTNDTSTDEKAYKDLLKSWTLKPNTQLHEYNQKLLHQLKDLASTKVELYFRKIESELLKMLNDLDHPIGYIIHMFVNLFISMYYNVLLYNYTTPLKFQRMIYT